MDECGWANVGVRDRVDDIDWDRVSGQATRTSTYDHTLGSEKGKQPALATFVYSAQTSVGFAIPFLFFRIPHGLGKE